MIKLEDIKQYEEYIIQTRRNIHMYPETGFEETKTSALIEKELRSFGFDVISGIGKTGLIGILKGSKGKTIALRADIDALNMQEENDVPYKSKIDGKMHSCGHDTHTAMLLGAAKYFSEHKDQVQGTIKFIFQAAEEGPMPGGGSFVVKEGHLNDVDAVFGLHIVTRHQNKTISIKKGPAMAAPDEFKITITGVGTHASAPHTGIDPIYVASQVINGLQSITSRNLNPIDSAVVSICTINGGTAFNILPESVSLGGTIRTLKPEIREQVFTRLKDITTHICKAHNAKADIEIIPAYPPVINDPVMSDFVLDVARKSVGEELVIELQEPSMGGEDFAYYLQEKPGAFFWLGAAPKGDRNPAYNHNPLFNPDESSFLIGTLMHINIVLEYLK